jgi:tetratricopeptide (TPR) repeat protein
MCRRIHDWRVRIFSRRTGSLHRASLGGAERAAVRRSRIPAHYDEAIAHFRKATELDPDLPAARIDLGNALAETVIPGLDTPQNLEMARQAVSVFQEILRRDPHNVASMKQIAAIDFSVKKYDDARTWHLRVLDENPLDAGAAYYVGVIDWTEAHRNAISALAAAGLQDDGEGNLKAPPEVLETIRVQNAPLVEEALRYLAQAVDNQPDDEDAMAYLNLIYRRKADVDWADEAARKADLEEANEWARRGMETRKANEDKRKAESGSPIQ